MSKEMARWVRQRLSQKQYGARQYAEPAFKFDAAIKEAFPKEDVTTFLNELLEDDIITVINGWVTASTWRTRPTPSTGNDDLDWKLGVGRFGQ